MKNEQVVVDYWTMLKTSCLCLLLAFSGYILLKMVQTIFWLPGHLQKNQRRLEELAAQYAQEIDEKEREQLGKMVKGEMEPAVTKQSDIKVAPAHNQQEMSPAEKKEK